jgi:hypothetical protein
MFVLVSVWIHPVCLVGPVVFGFPAERDFQQESCFSSKSIEEPRPLVGVLHFVVDETT